MRSSMHAEVEAPTGQHVAVAVAGARVGGEQARVVPLLHDQVGDGHRLAQQLLHGRRDLRDLVRLRLRGAAARTGSRVRCCCNAAAPASHTSRGRILLHAWGLMQKHVGSGLRQRLVS